ncbi:MAG: MFS transporter [Deltaproteobacteria bacterium]|nr:MFS transporter [Deltaproteobacteria bacterium]
MTPSAERHPEARRPLGECGGALALVCSVFFVNLSSRAVLAPLMPAVERDLGIGHGQAGSLFLLLSVGYCVGLLGSGFVSARLTHHVTISLSSLAVGGVLVGLAASRGLAGLWAGTAALGAVAGLYLPSGVATVTALVAPRDWGKALAIHELAPNLALTVAPLAAEGLLGWTSWRGALGIFGVAALSVGAGFALMGRGGRFRGEEPSRRAVGALASSPRFWVLLLLFALGLAATIGLYAVLPLYLTAGLGLPRGDANRLVAASRACGLVTVLAAGWLSDRLGPRRAMASVLAASGAATLWLAAVPAAWVAPAVIVQAIPGAWFFPAAFAALARVGPLAVAFSVPLAMVLGGGVVPAVVGLLGERGSFGGGIALVGALMLLGAGLALGLREESKDSTAGAVPLEPSPSPAKEPERHG